MMRLGMFPSVAITFSRSTVSAFPTISLSTRGRYFSIQGRSICPDEFVFDEDGCIILFSFDQLKESSKHTGLLWAYAEKE